MLKVSAFYLKNQKSLFLKKYDLGRSLYAKRVPTDGALLSQFSGKVLDITCNLFL